MRGIHYAEALDTLENLRVSLVAARERRRISQRKAAREIGISENTLLALENGSSRGRGRTLAKVLAWLCVHDPSMPHRVGPVRCNDPYLPIAERRYWRNCQTCGWSSGRFSYDDEGLVNSAAHHHIRDGQRAVEAIFDGNAAREEWAHG